MSLELQKTIQRAIDVYPAKGKDAERIRLFAKAVVEKYFEIVESGKLDDLFLFSRQLSSLLTSYIAKGQEVARRPWAYLFKDPFRECREDVRSFAKRWKMDEELIKALG